MTIYQEHQSRHSNNLILKSLLSSSFMVLLLPSVALAAPSEDSFLLKDKDSSLGQVPSVRQLSDVKPTDWAYEALQSLVQRYGCISGYPDNTFRGDRPLTRYEFAASLNACLNQISQLVADNINRIDPEDLSMLQRLEADFSTELATLQGRVDNIEARTAVLEDNQFSTTTRLVAEVITAVTDSFGNGVGGDEDPTETFFAYRGRLNFESSFTGEDLLRVRMQFGNFFDEDNNSKIGLATGTGMTRLNFDDNKVNELSVPHIRYYFPVSDSLSFAVGPVGIGYTDITTTVTPAVIADDGNGVPSLFGAYDPIFRRGGGGVGANWKFSDELTLTIGYLADNPDSPLQENGLFNGGYNALAHLVYLGDRAGAGLAYSHGYTPDGGVNLTGGTGSALSASPFGNSIATSNNIVAGQGFYRFSDNFQIHGWGGYIWANAKDSGLSDISDGLGGTDALLVNAGDSANAWYGAVGLSFPDLGGEGNLPGIIFGVPPHVTSSDVREENDNAYHVEAFYRLRVNDNISVTPGVWAIFNPENNSDNDTQYVGVLRTTFNF
ncbi:iron uptake porin [Pleurocapsa sp. PCC 7319]|uniref:iron uptake porin n=1 Tax=Pleurocapsa sp. PCC 7319 TaxID=118161 RepID=UPI0003470EF7|nr:iron uptake porin [Pleurocapsa sp. PCC 7319]